MTGVGHTRREDHIEKTAVYKPRKEASEETNPADTFILDFPAPIVGRK